MLAHKFCSLRGTENHDKHARCPLSNDTMFWLMFLLVRPTAIQNPLCIKFGSVNKSPASNGPREKKKSFALSVGCDARRGAVVLYLR